jgi:uncharacterized protein YjbI with pentapeptide repeats
MLAGAVAVGVTAFVITTWLLTIASHAAPGTDRATARLDAVRTGLAAGAGAGAAVGLMLAFRRQYHQEVATALTDLDATERRITELYTKAVEQLGSDKAPVRLGGLYALERLAQDNPTQRQTIVNVICAYLRMPFLPKIPSSSQPVLLATEDQEEPDKEAKTKTLATDDAWRQEKQVRLTAQHILSEHLRVSEYVRTPALSQSPANLFHTSFWPDIHLDLTGATLINFSFGTCLFGKAKFQEATFSGSALFSGATFKDAARFDGATFNDAAWFNNANFNELIMFDQVTFKNEASFNEATFSSEAWFSRATFNGQARFRRATFNQIASFGRATFNHIASFGEATFNGKAVFGEATFNRIASFGEATFNHDVSFSGATSSSANAINLTQVKLPLTGGDYLWPAGWHLIHDDSGKRKVVRERKANGQGD